MARNRQVNKSRVEMVRNKSSILKHLAIHKGKGIVEADPKDYMRQKLDDILKN